MKGMKGKLFKKLKSIGHIGPLKHARVFQMNASDGLLNPVPPDSDTVFRTPSVRSLSPPDPSAIDVSEILRDLGEEEEEEEEEEVMIEGQAGIIENIIREKENIQPSMPATKTKDFQRRQEKRPLSELDIGSLRHPDLNSTSLFDPALLAAFQKAVTTHLEVNGLHNNHAEKLSSEEPTVDDPLSEFELHDMPPQTEGSAAVVLYTTSIRGIRKTFEDCNSIRFLLRSLRVIFSERDVSMHKEFREQLWRTLGGRVVPPRLFVKGRYIGGADEVVGLHERGKLVGLLDGNRSLQPVGSCDHCGGFHFILCSECSGSCKIISEEDDEARPLRCPNCNENGLIVCPSCC
ncbi:hypothetical protein ACLOJK_006088 [Asimina triloba]